jgi:group I intron endonuclease
MLVYLLLNRVNGKAYIGQHTGFQLEKRWNKTLSSRHKANFHLASAIEKYGAKKFSRTILCYASCQQELDLLEQFWIAVYRSTDRRFGYNQQSGGRRWRGPYTKELRRLISEATRKAWARKSEKEKWEFAFATKIRWLMMTESQRKQITGPMTSRQNIKPWNKGKRGIPSARKGRKFGPQKNPCRHKKPYTEKHKQRISQALRRYHRKRRRSEKG